MAEYVLNEGDSVVVGKRTYSVCNGNICFRYLEEENEVVNSIINAVTEVYNVSFDSILSSSRDRRIADARHAMYYFLRRKCEMTFQSIGDMTNRKHCSVLLGSRKFDELKEFDPDTKRNYICINGIIGDV